MEVLVHKHVQPFVVMNVQVAQAHVLIVVAICAKMNVVVIVEKLVLMRVEMIVPTYAQRLRCLLLVSIVVVHVKIHVMAIVHKHAEELVITLVLVVTNGVKRHVQKVV